MVAGPAAPWGAAGGVHGDGRLAFRSSWGLAYDFPSGQYHFINAGAAPFANRLRGQHAVHAGDDPYWLKRLPNHYITRLPGRGRQYWFS